MLDLSGIKVIYHQQNTTSYLQSQLQSQQQS